MPTREERYLLNFGPPPGYGGGYPSSGYGTLQSLLMERGRLQAEAAQRSGDIWANALSNVGQTLAGGIQKYGEEQQLKKRDSAWMQALNDPEFFKDPKVAYTKTVGIWGPEKGPQMFQGVVGAMQLAQPKRNPETDQKALGAMTAAYLEAGPAGRALMYPNLRGLVQNAIPDFQMPEQHSLQFDEQVAVPFAKQFAPPKPKGKFKDIVTAEGVKAFNEETGDVGPVIGQPPAPKPPAPAFQSKDVLLDGRPAMVNFDSHSGRYSLGDKDVTDRVRPIPPQGPQPRQPEWRDAEDAEGNPVLVDYATGQTKPYPGGAMPKPGATEANRIAAADAALSSSAEVKAYLSKPEVRKAIGPLMGRFNSLTQAAGAGDPVAVELVGMLKSYSALQPQIHGFRNVRFAQDIEKLLSTHQTPETLEAALRGIDTAAANVRDRRRTPKGETPKPSGARPRATNPQTGAVVEFDGTAWVPAK